MPPKKASKKPNDRIRHLQESIRKNIDRQYWELALFDVAILAFEMYADSSGSEQRKRLAFFANSLKLNVGLETALEEGKKAEDVLGKDAQRTAHYLKSLVQIRKSRQKAN